MPFQRATKAQSRLRVAIDGPSGSGKSYTGLTMCTVFAAGKPFAAIDTERGSLSKYADIFEFDVLELTDFGPQSYIRAMKDAQEAEYPALFIDSITHEWNGRGGILQIVDEEQKRLKMQSSFQAWNKGKAEHQKFVDAMLATDLHLVVTMRSKTEHALTDNNGRKEVKKLGMAPVQSDGMEYEFDVVADMDLEHNLIVSKTRFPGITDAVVNKPDAEFAQKIYDWATSGTVPVPKTRSDADIDRIKRPWEKMIMDGKQKDIEIPDIDWTKSDQELRGQYVIYRAQVDEA